jgi:hypothetical protein
MRRGRSCLRKLAEAASSPVPSDGSGAAGDAELARRYVTLLTPLLVAGERELDHGLELFESQAELGAFDALLAATALSHEADALVSADQSFASVPGLAHVAPGSDAFDSLVST